MHVSHAKDGQEGHGGDTVVAEFLLLANDIAEAFGEVEVTLLPSETFSTEFDEALRDTTVTSAENVYLGDVEVDAINFPTTGDSRIIVGRSRWLDNRINNFQRRRLVVHEYLSILGYEDFHYKLSHSLVLKIEEEKFSQILNHHNDESKTTTIGGKND
jgi:hypothetical protein